MKNWFSFMCVVVFCLLIKQSFAAPQKINGLYVNTFGNPERPAIVFLHGGPAYYAWNFEEGAASKLADKGYYVIVYDQRGQGRSEISNKSADYTFAKYVEDLKMLVDTLKLKTFSLLGHSFGGLLAIEFERKYPGLAQRLILSATPVRFASIFDSIFQRSEEILKYSDSAQLETKQIITELYSHWRLYNYLGVEEKTTWLSYMFALASSYKLYEAKNPSPEYLELKKQLADHPIKDVLNTRPTAMAAFLKNEDFPLYDGSVVVIKNAARFCGFYGSEDGLFTKLELDYLSRIFKSSLNHNFSVLEHSGHYSYLDQQEAFFAQTQTCLEGASKTK